ncbi:MAG TPA: serine protease [Candidatus Binatia bacterium]|nr:serine protease [Candidatus Binatia bacterium]
MFVSAVEQASEFTRPIYIISRLFGSTDVQPGAATLFLVNADGWALTCRHVAQALISGDEVNKKYQTFKVERDALGKLRSRRTLKDLEQKHGFNRTQVAEIKFMVGCAEGFTTFDWHLHPNVDVALLQFKGFTNLGCTTFPTFAKNGSDLKQGKFLCRLGFPFPEFTNFSYDAATEAINFSSEGRRETPRFPIEGMVTRYIGAQDAAIVGFELSTPGLKGQSGGPTFDTDGRIWGMQSSTNHLDLDFDVDLEVFRQGKKKRVQDSAFLHVGHCVHVEVLKTFMREKGVAFVEG